MTTITWIARNALAHSKYPRRRNLSGLYKKGIRAIVSLERRPDSQIIKEKGFEYLEVYVRDFTAPTIDQLMRIIEFIDLMITKKKPVLVHCLVGGRSGTVIAGYLIYHGKSSHDAISEVRSKIPYAVDVPSQGEILKEFEMIVRSRKMSPETKITDTEKSKKKDYFGDTWYLQTDKIWDMYGKVVRRVEEQIITAKSGVQKTSLGTKVSFGDILKYLLLDVNIDATLAKEHAESDQVIQTLSSHEKLHVVLKALEKEGLCCDLNECLRQHKKIAHYVRFNGEANFTLSEEDPEIVSVRGKVEDYEFVCLCSKKYFTQISSSLFMTLLSAKDLLRTEYLDVFCVGTVMGQSASKEKCLILSLFYIGGSTEDIHSIYKKQS